MIITVDGFSGCGKSTVCKIVASQLGFHFISSGAVYRLYAYLHKNGMKDFSEAEEYDITFNSHGDVFMKAENVDTILRSYEIGSYASEIAKDPTVRKNINSFIRSTCSKAEDCIIDGRDMGTEVFKDAVLKFFLYGSIACRVHNWERGFVEKHGYLDLREKEMVFRDLTERDKKDTEREVSPLRPADDAILFCIENTSSIEIADTIVELVRRQRNENNTGYWSPS